ncbi:ATP-binding protein [Piscinibacter sp. XHJ-5]|uniref:ATP-binding protein n=1 Tax=Piscinibacter sp. XHJ-5 TaxID=3037797 RepID=UPI00245333AC|nr:ATP-binding protein [Piscinibacter sp. XHJ-5]
MARTPFATRLVLLVWLWGAAVAVAADAMDDWRGEATRTRILAENDAPRAYTDAKRLHAALPANAAPVDRARSLNLLARIETYLALTTEAARHAQEAFDLATKHDDRIGQAESDLTVVMNAINQGRMDAMITATNHGLAILEGVDRPDLLGEALLRTTVMYRRMEQFDESVAVALQAMEIARRTNHPLMLAYAHHGLGLAFEQSFRYAESREHYAQMRLQAKAVPSKLMEGLALGGMAGAAASTGDLPTGERLLREAITLYQEMGAPFAQAFGEYGLADNLNRQGRHAEALALMNGTVARYARHPNPIGLWFALNLRSSIYQALGEVAPSRTDAEQAYAVARQLALPIYLSGSAQRMAAIAAAKGDHKRAYELSLEASEMTTRAAREKASTRMVQLTKRYETESKQREINELTRRNEQQTAQLNQRELQQRWLWTVLGGVVLLLTAAALFMVRLRASHRELQSLNVKLQQSESDVRALNASLEQRVQARTSELRQQARYLRTLIDMLPMWAWLKDTQSRYLAVNQATADAVGMPVEALVGSSDTELWPKELADAYRADDAEVMASRTRKTVEEPVIDGDRKTWVETYKAPVIDEDGTVLGTVGVARNISDRKAAEAAREAALAEAERLARQRSDFLAQMSHELRTPLNGILGFAQLLQRDRSLSERQARGLRIIDESGQHLLALINDILDLARIDAAKLELFPTEVDLSTFLQVLSDIVRVKAEEKGLLFSLRPAPGLPATVRVDETRLRQVLLNLLSNAVKFTDRGQVVLSVQSLPTAVVRREERHGVSPARLRFEVRDSGAGMSEAQLERLFQPFEQVGEARKREGGAGLGLAISRQLIRLMGGDIHVSSRPRDGSTFWFELDVPATDATVAESTARGDPVGYEGRRRTVLVVDDVVHNRTMLIDALGMAGFEMAEAADGAQALEVAMRERPDIVVMDLTMPVMDGFESMRRMRLMPELADVPVIATSASATPETAARARASGASAFVAKPIAHDTLLATMGHLLGLTWIFEAGEEPLLEGVDLDDERLVGPPPHEMAVLRQLARTGNMRTIVERAEYLKTLDPRYARFADRLARLAEQCQSKAIANLVDWYSTERDAT